MKVISITGVRNFTNPEPNPDGHWVELVFQNEYGVHRLELNGESELPEEPEVRRDLEWLLWDYGLLSQEYGASPLERARAAQRQFDIDLRNYMKAKAYMLKLGSF